jgi:hypothetical protein
VYRCCWHHAVTYVYRCRCNNKLPTHQDQYKPHLRKSTHMSVSMWVSRRFFFVGDFCDFSGRITLKISTRLFWFLFRRPLIQFLSRIIFSLYFILCRLYRSRTMVWMLLCIYTERSQVLVKAECTLSPAGIP